jgi:hypothetical protein
LFGGAILNLLIKPFVNEGINPVIDKTTALSGLENVIISGLPIENLTIGVFWGEIAFGDFVSDIYNALMPNFIQSFLLEQIQILSYLPAWIQTPIVILIVISFILVIYEAIMLIVPG